MFNLTEVTKRIMDNKRKRGFNVTDLNEEFCHLYGEVSEAHSASKEEINLELADICIFLFAIADIVNIDLTDNIIGSFNDALTDSYSHSFLETNTDELFLCLYEAVADAHNSYFKKKSNFKENLGKIFYYVLQIALEYKVDILAAILEKVEINDKREYVNVNGVDIKKENVEEYLEEQSK